MRISLHAPKTPLCEVASRAVTCSWSFGLGMLLLGCLVVDTSWAQDELSFTRQDFRVGDGPFEVTVGDFNGDSQQDLATSDLSCATPTGRCGSVFIVLGRGDGAFEPAQDFTVGGPSFSVTVGDFNGDGQQDLATANLLGGVFGSVSILLGQGDGAFEPARDFAVGGSPMSVTMGDFNGDGQQDVATANDQTNTVSILLGRGDGTFEPAQDFWAAGVIPRSIIVGDFNGDSQQDLATSGFDGLSILLGNGDGTFEPAQNFAVGGDAFSVKVGDFNGDGQQDLATANSNRDSVSILLGNGDGTFEPAQDFGVGVTPFSVAVGDFNGDGQQDLVTANSGGNSVSILLGRGDGSFGPAQDFGAGSVPRSVTVGDFNGDGQQDLAAANNFNPASVSILINSNTAVEIAVKIDIKPGSFPNSINPKSKGKIPVAILTTDRFDATTVDPTTVRFGRTGAEAAPAHFALKDVDGDGNTDMILHFKTQKTGIRCGDTSASLTGNTVSGQAIEGSDSIRTVGRKQGGANRRALSGAAEPDARMLRARHRS